MKKIVLIACALFLVLNMGFAENEGKTEAASKTSQVTGKVLDKKTGEAPAGVMVVLIGTDQYVFSDFDGNFSIEI